MAFTNWWIGLAALSSACAPRAAPTAANAPAAQVVQAGAQPELHQPVVIYIVRHAEKAGTSGDVPLNQAGEQRAAVLAEVLADAALVSVHSTDTARTRSTAAPAALHAGVEVQLYDGADPTVLVETLRSAPGAHLVVGHSNTVPDLVHRLGGDPGPELHHDDYDRLYINVLSPAGPTTSLLLHYGN